MKKKLLLTSILSIVMCFSLICGATFALFTSESKVNIAIQSATVNVTATVKEGSITTKSFDKIISENVTEGAFENGGTAKFDETSSTLYLDLLTPGDEVSFVIDVTNNSNVSVKYRVEMFAKGELAPALVGSAVINGEEMAIANGATDWVLVTAGTEIDDVTVNVEFPDAGDNNTYQDKSASISFAFIAVQGNAPVNTAATTEELQAFLDSNINNQTIYLKEGVAYGALTVKPTANNDTVMCCTSCEFTTTDAVEFKTHLSDGKWHATPKYTTNFKNVTIVGAEGATIAGLTVSIGHVHGDVYDYVLDKDYEQGSAYYATLYVNNITFKDVDFTASVNFATSDKNTVYDRVTFDGCSFTTGGTASANGYAIRYYNESDNGNVRNIIVNECEFKNCYQGIYTGSANGITVTNSSFSTTGHNAIAIQSQGVVDLKDVVITGNTFENIGDRVIRFNEIGADSNIIIQNNIATNSGDENNEVIKATSIAAGVVTSISGNNWNDGVVVNTELQDK